MLKKIYFQAEVIKAAAKHLYCHGASLSLPYFPTMTGCNYSNQTKSNKSLYLAPTPAPTEHNTKYYSCNQLLVTKKKVKNKNKTLKLETTENWRSNNFWTMTKEKELFFCRSWKSQNFVKTQKVIGLPGNSKDKSVAPWFMESSHAFV